MKRLLFSLAMLGMTSILAIGATTAYFSDTEISSGNTFTAGTLDLTVDGINGGEVKSLTLTNMKPGDKLTRKYFRLKNIGSLAGVPKVCLKNLQNIESTGITEFERDGGFGELGSNINLIVDVNGHWLMTSGQKLNSFENHCWTPDNPADIEFFNANADIVSPNEEMIFGVALDLPINTESNIQGDSVTFDLEFTLTQE